MRVACKNDLKKEKEEEDGGIENSAVGHYQIDVHTNRNNFNNIQEFSEKILEDEKIVKSLARTETKFDTIYEVRKSSQVRAADILEKTLKVNRIRPLTCKSQR